MKGTYVEGIKEEVVLSPAHALSLIAAGEGMTKVLLQEIDGLFPPKENDNVLLVLTLLV